MRHATGHPHGTIRRHQPGTVFGVESEHALHRTGQMRPRPAAIFLCSFLEAVSVADVANVAFDHTVRWLQKHA